MAPPPSFPPRARMRVCVCVYVRVFMCEALALPMATHHDRYSRVAEDPAHGGLDRSRERRAAVPSRGESGEFWRAGSQATWWNATRVG